MDGEVIDALLGLVFEFLEDDVEAEVFDAAADDHGINRDGADWDGAVLDDRLAAFVEVAAGGEVHDGVGAPSFGPLELFDFLGGAGGDGRRAHVGVDLGQSGAADAHRFKFIFQVNFIGRDDHAAGGDLNADLLWRQMRLAQGDALDLRRRLCRCGLRPVASAVEIIARAAKSNAVRSDAGGIPGVSGELKA